MPLIITNCYKVKLPNNGQLTKYFIANYLTVKTPEAPGVVVGAAKFAVIV